jgi:hypothetical protein
MSSLRRPVRGRITFPYSDRLKVPCSRSATDLMNVEVRLAQVCQSGAVRVRRTKTPEPRRAPARLVQKSGRDGGGKPRPDYGPPNLSP